VAEADGAVEGLGAEGLFEAGELALEKLFLVDGEARLPG
jgi:hypothetical protein